VNLLTLLGKFMEMLSIGIKVSLKMYMNARIKTIMDLFSLCWWCWFLAIFISFFISFLSHCLFFWSVEEWIIYVSKDKELNK